ncbi:protein of unknown function [Acidithiobacillus ferrivorans]|uniref:Transposase n=1 Tax=Acidithiobacillus ferrivorans TaxID=160808 RepID=A0ABY1MPE3_9PROT|nr:protein of unknown function [Acidithiobacillus ferrivorans]
MGCIEPQSRVFLVAVYPDMAAYHLSQLAREEHRLYTDRTVSTWTCTFSRSTRRNG